MKILNALNSKILVGSFFIFLFFFRLGKSLRLSYPFAIDTKTSPLWYNWQV